MILTAVANIISVESFHQQEEHHNFLIQLVSETHIHNDFQQILFLHYSDIRLQIVR